MKFLVGEMMANEKKHEMKKPNRPEPYPIGGPLKKGEETPFGNPKLFWKVIISNFLKLLNKNNSVFSSKIWSHQLSMR